ncbi:MAG TPA: M23 family metallopeptidase [Candidatus Tectomicrobia bacterium]|nr:M23 family metallopeptidase [Candidatus Tectomicrobia bacterium]
MKTRICVVAFSVVFFITTQTLAQNAFPGRADDLAPGEVWYWKQSVHPSGASQGKGHDLGMAAWDASSSSYKDCKSNGKLVDCDNSLDNDEHLIYNQPVFASASGMVVRCWRNAPENPDPPNLHPNRERMIAGGNFMFVQDAAGDSILYAHFRPGTIPGNLCPNDDVYARSAAFIGSGTWAPDTAGDVPAADQANVQQGDFLGCAGNSGSSSGPHLHIHKSANFTLGSNSYGPAMELPFDSFRWKPVPPDGAQWTSASNAVLPSGPIAILPPAQKKTFAPAAWITTDLNDFQAKRAAWAEKGLKIHDFESYPNASGQRVYAAIYRPLSGEQKFLVNLPWEPFFSEWQKLESQGFRIDDFDSYMLGSVRVYAGVFNPGNFSPRALINYKWEDFLKAWSDIEKQGYRMHDHEIYRMGDQWVYSGIFKPDNYKPLAWFGQTWSDFLPKWQQAEKDGYFLHDLEVYRDGRTLKYNGVFRPSGQNKGAWINQPWSGFLSKWGQFEDANYRIHDFEGHEGTSSGMDRQFSGVFLRSRTPTPCD